MKNWEWWQFGFFTCAFIDYAFDYYNKGTGLVGAAVALVFVVVYATKWKLTE